MPCVLTIDLEVWPQMVLGELTGQERTVGGAGLDRAVDRLLALTHAAGVRATVFTVGATARSFPGAVRRLADAGHEIGAHGDVHRPLHRMPRAQRRQGFVDVRRRLEDLVGAPVRGFRAPYFSIVRANLDALEELADAGYAYDSSIVPAWHRRYGVAGWPRGPERVAGGRLVELPLATATLWGRPVPVGGGGYWRALPQAAVLTALDTLEAQGLPAVVYLHPYQLDPAPPEAVPGPLGPLQRLRAGLFRASQRVGRRGNATLLERALARGRWITAGQLADAFLTPDGSSATPASEDSP